LIGWIERRGGSDGGVARTAGQYVTSLNFELAKPSVYQNGSPFSFSTVLDPHRTLNKSINARWVWW
jgi:hypothetical protein